MAPLILINCPFAKNILVFVLLLWQIAVT